jgi:hypothetical protein
MAAIIAVLILSGLVKTCKNIYIPDLSHTLVLWATWLHNIFFVLFVLAFVAHIGAILLKPNRPLARGIFTGSVRLDYARRRHPLWIAGMNPPESLPSTAKLDEAISATPPLADATIQDRETVDAATPETSTDGNTAFPQDTVTSGVPETDRETDEEKCLDGSALKLPKGESDGT